MIYHSESISLGILSPSHEFRYWSDMSGSEKAKSRKRAQIFYDFLQPLTSGYAGLESLSINEALELVEHTQDALNELWKQTDAEKPYPEARMKHLLQIIGKCI